MRQAVHGGFDRHRDLLLHLFGGAALPLGDDVHVVVRDVGIGSIGRLWKEMMPQQTGGARAPGRRSAGSARSQRGCESSFIPGRAKRAFDGNPHQLGACPDIDVLRKRL